MFICKDEDGFCGVGITPQEAYEDYEYYNSNSPATLSWFEGEAIQVKLTKVVKHEIVKTTTRRK